ncbi:MAG: DEAD/DEAH box helicase [Prevotella sp.]|nr:DEAD/DEAH box helicase [Prevotella sp.]
MCEELLERIGVKSLSDMQMAAVESIARGEGDVVVLSPTGSGKTLAYLLPIVEIIERSGDDALQCVVMVPSRELARQSYDYARRLTRAVRFYACHGGRSAMYEHRELREARPQVIFSTPGRLNDHIAKGNIDVSGVRWLVIDEFDKCLEFGFRDEMSRAVGALPKSAMRVLLSATDAEDIPDFVDMGNVEKIDFLADNDPLSTRINKFVVSSATADKLEALSALLRTFGRSRTIVYAGFRESVVRITDYLVSEGFVCASLHGGLEQEERNEAVYHFLNKSANILVSTNLSSRGLDLPDVDNIVHYHLPDTEEDYIHRSGRTARWEAEGNTYFILSPKEHLPEYISDDVLEVEQSEEQPEVLLPELSTIYIGKGKNDKICKSDVLGLLCKKGGLTASDIGRIDIYDRFCRAAISRRKMTAVLKRLKGEKIKGVRTIVEEERGF